MTLNSIQIHMISQQQNMKNPFQITLLSLSTADLLTAITLLLDGGIYALKILRIIPAHDTFTVVQTALYGFSLSSSMLHVIFIAIQRLLAILFPLRIKSLLTKRRCYLALFLAWVTCFTFVGGSLWRSLSIITSGRMSVHRLKMTTSSTIPKQMRSSFTVKPSSQIQLTPISFIVDHSELTVVTVTSMQMRSTLSTRAASRIHPTANSVTFCKSTIIVKYVTANTTPKHPLITVNRSRTAVTISKTTAMPSKMVEDRSLRALNIKSMKTFSLTKGMSPNWATTIDAKYTNVTIKSFTNATNKVNATPEQDFSSLVSQPGSKIPSVVKTPTMRASRNISIIYTLPYILFSYLIKVTGAALILIYSLAFILLNRLKMIDTSQRKSSRNRSVLIHSVLLTTIFIICTFPFALVKHKLLAGDMYLANLTSYFLFLNVTFNPVLYFLFNHCKNRLRCCHCASKRQPTT